MLLFWLLGIFVGFFTNSDGVNTLTNQHASDFQFSQNPNFLAVISYMLQSNHFFPMDTYFAIAGIYFIIYGYAVTVKVVEIALNVVRGAGMRL